MIHVGLEKHGPWRLTAWFGLTLVVAASQAFAQPTVGSQTSTNATGESTGPGAAGTPGAAGVAGAEAEQPYAEEPVIEISVASEQMPVLLVVPKTEADTALAQQIAAEIELTGLFNVKTAESLKLGPGLPQRTKWPALTTAAVVVENVPDSVSFPKVISDTHHASEPDVKRHRELTRYPGTDAIMPSVMADAIVEDVVGSRAHMSGKILFADGSTHGERSIRVMRPNGTTSRRVSGFGDLARGGDFDAQMRAWYASEDRAGKLQLFQEGGKSPVTVSAPGYVQSVSFSPDGKHMVLSMGEGTRVRTWLGTSPQQGEFLPLDSSKTALSPSVNDQGHVVHAMGPTKKGPFSVYANGKRVSPAGVWAAMPSFCSTLVEERVVFMTRAGRSWNLRITSLTSGASRVIAHKGMAPSCSPDGKTVAFYSPGLYGQGPGIYLVADFGGKARKVWSGQASGLRWRGGEKLPTKTIVR